LATFGSKAVKNISFGFTTAILLLFYFIIHIIFYTPYDGNVAPVGKMLKSKYINSAVLVG
jgi:hypothetical protein